MADRKTLSEVYKQNLENDIIKVIAELKRLELRKAFDIYYSSKLEKQIMESKYSIESMDVKYFA